MTTEELITVKASTFAAVVARLDGGACERHARDLFHRLGGPTTFETYLAAVFPAAARLDNLPEERASELEEIGLRLFPHVSPGYDILTRLSIQVLKVIVERMTSGEGVRTMGNPAGGARV